LKKFCPCILNPDTNIKQNSQFGNFFFLQRFLVWLVTFGGLAMYRLAECRNFLQRLVAVYINKSLLKAVFIRVWRNNLILKQ